MIKNAISANGITGFLIKNYYNDIYFRVYNNEGFIDYKIQHSDLEVTINDQDAYFYDDVLNHSPDTLGIEAKIVQALDSNKPPDLKTQIKFLKLRDEWNSKTRGFSSASDLYLDISYQQIIGLGPAVLPFLLTEVKSRINNWHWALMAITGENPVPNEMRGNFEEICSVWENWGISKGFLLPVDLSLSSYGIIEFADGRKFWCPVIEKDELRRDIYRVRLETGVYFSYYKYGESTTKMANIIKFTPCKFDPSLNLPINLTP